MNNSLRCMSPASFWMPRHVPRSAWLEHAPFAFWLVQALRPRCFVELGTEFGFSYLAVCQAVQTLGLPTRCYAVDTWKGDEGTGAYGEEVFAQLSEINEKLYGGFSNLVRSLFDHARPNFLDGEIDLLHIDGRHTYEDTKANFLGWLPKLSDRAVVMIHDTNVRRQDFGVWKFWQEVSGQYLSFEFLHGYGLGVLGVGRDLPDAVRTLFSSDAEAEAAIRTSYARLGGSITQQAMAAGAQAAINQLRAEIATRDAKIAQLERVIAARGATVATR
jgi:hypothetical protein